MNTWRIDFQQPESHASRGHISIEAEYYRREDGWFTFKNAEHKAVLDIPAGEVLSVKREPESGPAHITVPGGSTGAGTLTVRGAAIIGSSVLSAQIPDPYSSLQQRITGVNLDPDEAERMIKLIRSRIRDAR
ncbi:MULTISPECIES: hypothetical protein [unclassified Cryobacterium]|uniref:hypothetical protein n=1 Tax=unclassified Cryobacterium TaxID=2649013 RepID=UPI00106A5409|nr:MULTISPECIES: hypothetical protein [unclassified Cryobacterium]TFC59413.1 hypothetical protein E3O68_00495 [Cryobacterium sp. TMB3-1-2]TFC67209.1 hypothetical protein E3T21_17190 [Cryobacterium sp. TMB3-15]TFC73278.1 hypothetical protein E3T22_16865 [Cryobacterium sp. TMB3-10]TFD46166.1 hypothetical protein E3T58_01500 [Cryobacterium sp. TMB3-12]